MLSLQCGDALSKGAAGADFPQTDDTDDDDTDDSGVFIFRAAAPLPCRGGAGVGSLSSCQ